MSLEPGLLFWHEQQFFFKKYRWHKATCEAVIDVLSKEIKQRKDATIEYKKGNRQDLVAQVENEIRILLEYLPQQLTEEEIRK